MTPTDMHMLQDRQLLKQALHDVITRAVLLCRRRQREPLELHQRPQQLKVFWFALCQSIVVAQAQKLQLCQLSHCVEQQLTVFHAGVHDRELPQLRQLAAQLLHMLLL